MINIVKRPFRIANLAKASNTTKGAWGHFTDEVLMRETPGLTID